MKFIFFSYIFTATIFFASADNGYRLWMRYDPITNKNLKSHNLETIKFLKADTNSATMAAAVTELKLGLEGMLGKKIPHASNSDINGLIITTTSKTTLAKSFNLLEILKSVGEEGYVIKSVLYQGKKAIVIAANSEVGVLYGCFHFLREIQKNNTIGNLNILEKPKLKIRVLNHWDNLDRTVERGYAGFSIWKWHLLPGYIDPRYKDYARANASIGINGTVLTNVNSNALVLTAPYLEKVSALAGVFRPYGIKVYLTARFSAPIELGKLNTADPLDPAVIKWWKDKTDEIYKVIPDFGGFLVKANSEGQPGPQNFGRTHADGANMLADALAPHKGIVMWRAFVYSNEQPEDRFKQAYNEFKPLDGKFRSNVLLQVKNGPIDFQPREPFSPLFGAMEKTPVMMEFQITQEYLGQGTHLIYQAPLYKEVLDADTYAKGKGSVIAKILKGSGQDTALTGMAGVSNIGDDINWTGHPFGQSNWFCFGRLAWNPESSAAEIAKEWLQMTFSTEEKFVQPMQEVMLNSREMLVDYMTPLGLHHIMGWSHHYGPGPWISNKPRADWTSVYYHRATKDSIGFDRTSKGSNALAQYTPEVRDLYGNLDRCPETFLLWFHRLPWGYVLKNKQTLWEAMCHHYERGAAGLNSVEKIWIQQKSFIDQERFDHVSMLLKIQKQEAWWWHDACLSYFQSINKLPYPKEITIPQKTTEYYQSREDHFVPGIN